MSQTGTRDEEIRAVYEEIVAKQKQLRELQLAGGPENVEDYALEGPDGEVRLSSLFGDQDDLIVVHNMGRSCPYCTLWADGFQGVLPHLENRAGFVVVSPDEPPVQAEFAKSRGWTFGMLSGAKSAFTKDMGYLQEHEGKWYAVPGYSTFRRREDGSIVRIGHSPFGPGDSYCAVWHMFDFLDGGAGDWQPRFSY